MSETAPPWLQQPKTTDQTDDDPQLAAALDEKPDPTPKPAPKKKGGKATPAIRRDIIVACISVGLPPERAAQYIEVIEQ